MRKRIISLFLALVIVACAVPVMPAQAVSNEQMIWDFFKSQGLSDAGAAGIMGNLQQESDFRPNNLEDKANINSGYTDEEFTAAVNDGTLTREQFISSEEFGLYRYTAPDGTVYNTYGYGIAQWTFYSRKADLYDFAQSKGADIDDLNMQLEFLLYEMPRVSKGSWLKSYLQTAVDVSDACLQFHNIFEGSSDTAAQIRRRINYAQAIYNQFSDADTYTITLDPCGGMSDTGSIEVKYGAAYGTLPTPTKKSCVFLGWYSEKNGQGTKYTGDMTFLGEADATWYADWGVENPFADVGEGDYYFDPVLWAVENDITAGTSETTFSPNADCTRAQVVTFLWRAAGEPKPTSTVNPFTDVKPSDYFYDAVLWAVENDITKGTSATEFSPNAACTRAQVVTFLWRTAGKPAPTSGNNPFTDVSTGSYYYDAVLWAVENDITKGTSAAGFSPDGKCSRAQIVTFLYRFSEE